MLINLKNLIIISLIIIMILGYQQKSYSSGYVVSVLDSDKDGIMSANLYDSNKNLISDETFSIVKYEGTSNKDIFGVNYIDFTAKLTNTGNTQLICIITNADPPQLWSTLPTGTINLNYNNVQGTWTSGLIEVAPFESNSPTRFSITVKCSSSGFSDVTKNGYIDILITSLAEKAGKVMFRTNAIQDGIGRYSNADPEDSTDGNKVWLAYDIDGDEILEKWGRNNVGSGISVGCTETGYPIILYFPSNFGDVWLLRGTSTYEGNIGMCVNEGIGSKVYWYDRTSGGFVNAVTYAKAIEPFTSENCPGDSPFPCQERYFESAIPLVATCEDNWQNQDETDIDCGGATCSRCDNFKKCIHNSDCFSNLCTGGICQISQHVDFRTTDRQYGSGSEIAYSPTCGSTLTPYYEYSRGHYSGNCESYTAWNGGGAVCSSYASCKIRDNLPYDIIGTGVDTSGTNFVLIKDETDVNYLWVCVNDADLSGYYRVKYRYYAGHTYIINQDPNKISYASPQMDMACD